MNSVVHLIKVTCYTHFCAAFSLSFSLSLTMASAEQDIPSQSQKDVNVPTDTSDPEFVRILLNPSLLSEDQRKKDVYRQMINQLKDVGSSEKTSLFDEDDDNDDDKENEDLSDIQVTENALLSMSKLTIDEQRDPTEDGLIDSTSSSSSSSSSSTSLSPTQLDNKEQHPLNSVAANLMELTKRAAELFDSVYNPPPPTSKVSVMDETDADRAQERREEAAREELNNKQKESGINEMEASALPLILSPFLFSEAGMKHAETHLGNDKAVIDIFWKRTGLFMELDNVMLFYWKFYLKHIQEVATKRPTRSNNVLCVTFEGPFEDWIKHGGETYSNELKITQVEWRRHTSFGKGSKSIMNTLQQLHKNRDKVAIMISSVIGTKVMQHTGSVFNRVELLLAPKFGVTQALYGNYPNHWTTEERRALLQLELKANIK